MTKRDWFWLSVNAALIVALVVAVATNARAEQVCSNQYDPLNQRWNLVCVERDSQVSGPPVTCRMVYDAMNGVWVQVCQ